MPCTLTDIARKTGVSVSTVSRVLHDDTQRYTISEKTKRMVRSAAEELRYTPNKLARGLRLRETRQIGVVIPDISNPFFATMVKSVSKEARKAGYSIIVCDSNEDTGIEEESVEVMLENRVDGILIAAVGRENEHLRNLHRNKSPVVMFDRWFEDLEVDAISVDNVKGGYLATQHLLHEGHQRIAFIQGLRGTNANDGRLQGYLQALQDAKTEVRHELVVGDDFGSLNGYLEAKSVLHLREPPTAIFAAGDLITMGILQAFKEENIVIPRDMSLVTFDDPTFASYISPPLTAIEQPVEKMGEMGVKMLIRRMRTPDAEFKRVLLDPRLIVRESVLSRPVHIKEYSTP